MNQDIFNRYREIVREQPVQDAPQLWDRVEESLELEKCWDDISNSLDKRKERFPIYLSLFIALIALTGYFLGDNLFVGRSNRPTASTENVSPVTQPILSDSSPPHTDEFAANPSVINQKTQNNSSIAEENSVAAYSQKPAEHANTDAEPEPEPKREVSINKDTTIFTTILTPFTSIQQSLVPITVALDIHLDAIRVDTTMDTETNRHVDSIEKKPSTYYVLASGGVAASILINNHTSKSLDPSSFEYVNANTNTTLQVGLGAHFNNNWILESRFHLLDQGGQTVHYWNEGKEVYATTKLHYSTLELSLGKFFVLGANYNSPTLSWQAGVYTSYLSSYSVRTNSEIEFRSSRFNTVDYGLMVRSDFNKRFQRYEFSAGLYLHGGLRNISAPDPLRPDYFNRSFNLSTGLNITCKLFLGRSNH